MEEDAARTKDLERMGLSVLRFQNKDVLKNLHGVTLEIDRAVKERAGRKVTTPQSPNGDSSPDKGSSNGGTEDV